MDYIFTPWRYRYVSTAANDDGCIFCAMLAEKDDAKALIVHRGAKNFIVLNRYPYTAGHVMITPYAHVAELADVDAETLSEMMLLAQRVQRALAAAYQPDGCNLGMNLGRAAGAGVAGHLHLHVLPRWIGDTNFMTTAGETRHIPEDLAQTYEKLRRGLAESAG
jgi:ATP adenylyltransferase